MEEHRFVIIGSKAVGKTRFTLRFQKVVVEGNYDPTILIEDVPRRSFVCDGEVCFVDILDGIMDNEFQPLYEHYMQLGLGFILIYSVTSRSSFDDIQKCYKDILKIKQLDKCPMVLVGNKSDLEQMREVSIAEGQELAKQYCIPFIETCVLNDINIDESVQLLVRWTRQISNIPTDTVPTKTNKCIIQ